MQGIGIDIGSRTIKTVLYDNGAIAHREVVDATSRPYRIATAIRQRFQTLPMLVTGYGRHMLEQEDVASITEIRACAVGTGHTMPGVRTVIDIGGQDLKIICLDTRGKVARFEMNDRCAAGTGRFLEIMAEKLDFALADFGTAALQGSPRLTISSVCTVFAESEVIGLLNKNESRKDIAYAVHKSVTNKIAGMYTRNRTAPDAPVALVGGGALNPAVVSLLDTHLGITVTVPDEPQIMAALGAAVLAAEKAQRS